MPQAMRVVVGDAEDEGSLAVKEAHQTVLALSGFRAPMAP